MMRLSLPASSPWASVVGLALLLVCSAPAPAPVPVAERRPRGPLVMSFREADSLAHSYGFVTGFRLGMRQRAAGWPAEWPVGPRWQSLAPGHLPGLRSRIAADSVYAYTHEPRCEYNYRVSYPAFTGPQATASLRRCVGDAFGVLGNLTRLRRHALFAQPKAHNEAHDDDEIYTDDEETEWDTCTGVGAYLLGPDTLVSVHGDSYSIGHGAHGNCAIIALNFSLARQEEVRMDDLFRPALRQALQHTVAAYAFQNEYLERQDPAARLHRPIRRWYPSGILAEKLGEWEDEARLRRWSAELRQPQGPHYTGGRTLFYLEGEQFYFGPTGVVFCIGADLWTWKILLPYAELPRYLCPEIGGRGGA